MPNALFSLTIPYEPSAGLILGAKNHSYNTIRLAEQEAFRRPRVLPAPIHESCLRLAFLLKARRSAGRWWSSDKADWKSVVVTWSGRRLCPLHCMNRLLLKRNIIPRTNIALSL